MGIRGLWPLVGVVNARIGQVTRPDRFTVGREKPTCFYRRLAAVYPDSGRFYVVQDNWTVHWHPDVVTALATLPRIVPVWLPTHAPRLSRIEELWRLLRQKLLRTRRFADYFDGLKRTVQALLNQFHHGSGVALRTIRLLNDGDLAYGQTLPLLPISDVKNH